MDIRAFCQSFDENVPKRKQRKECGLDGREEDKK
jgi:hypothetical protein